MFFQCSSFWEFGPSFIQSHSCGPENLPSIRKQAQLRDFSMTIVSDCGKPPGHASLIHLDCSDWLCRSNHLALCIFVPRMPYPIKNVYGCQLPRWCYYDIVTYENNGKKPKTKQKTNTLFLTVKNHRMVFILSGNSHSHSHCYQGMQFYWQAWARALQGNCCVASHQCKRYWLGTWSVLQASFKILLTSGFQPYQIDIHFNIPFLWTSQSLFTLPAMIHTASIFYLVGDIL